VIGNHVDVWADQAEQISAILKYDSQIEDMIALRSGQQQAASTMEQLGLLFESKTEFYGDGIKYLILMLVLSTDAAAEIEAGFPTDVKLMADVRSILYQQVYTLHTKLSTELSRSADLSL
jgi:hypothetical protein